MEKIDWSVSVKEAGEGGEYHRITTSCSLKVGMI